MGKPAAGVRGEAVFSEDGDYRYHLMRWLPLMAHTREGKTLCFVMLNPSKAGAIKTDATVSRLIERTYRLGYHRLAVVNLFALCSTDPAVLRSHLDPVGPENDNWIVETAREADAVVCAWGNDGTFRHRGDNVLRMLRQADVKPLALRMTAAGQPEHPLYLPYELQPAVPALWRGL